MIDHTGQKLPPLYAMLHGGGGGLPLQNMDAAAMARVQTKRGYHFKTAFGSTAKTFETISLMPPNPATQYSPRSDVGRRPAPACATTVRASSEQAKRAWAVKPEAPPQFVGACGAGHPATAASVVPSRVASTIVDAAQLKPRPPPRSGPPDLETAKRPARDPPGRSGPGGVNHNPAREASTPGHHRIIAARRGRKYREAASGGSTAAGTSAGTAGARSERASSSEEDGTAIAATMSASLPAAVEQGERPADGTALAATTGGASATAPLRAAAVAPLDDSSASAAAAARELDAEHTLILTPRCSDGFAEVRMRLRLGGAAPHGAAADEGEEDHAASTIQRSQRRKQDRQRATLSHAEEAAARELDSAREVLRANEAYFERMRLELEQSLRREEEQARAEGAAKIQAASRGRQQRGRAMTTGSSRAAVEPPQQLQASAKTRRR